MRARGHSVKLAGSQYKRMKDGEYVFTPGQWTHGTCYTGVCGHRGVSRVRKGLEKFTDDRQVHKWIQKV